MSNGTPPPPPPAGAPPAPPQASAPQPSAPQPNYSPPAASGSTGFPLWAKIGLGCGCLVAIIAIAAVALLGYGAKKAVDFAQDFEADPTKAVETLIELNPELDVVSSDREGGKITILNKTTGEEATFDYSDVREGRLNFESNEGSFSLDANEQSGLTVTTPEGETRIGGSLDDVPSWVPAYPNAQAEEQGGMTMIQNDTAQGLVGSHTEDSIETVESWFNEKLTDEGFEIERNSMNMGGTEQLMLQATKQGIDQLAVTIIREKDATQTKIAITYKGPKEGS